jgi:hemerythrin
MIVWDETMSTGEEIIDNQHKMLFQKFNEFDEAAAGSHTREAAGDILDFLQFYIFWHFSEEEKLMAEKQCPAAQENKEAHAEFKIKFDQFYKEWQEGTMTPELANKVYAEMGDWLVSHVIKVDVQLCLC